MTLKKFLNGFLKLAALIIILTLIQLAIQVGMEGMWLFGIPSPEEVTSVTIKYPSLTEENLEITDREKIETCVHLSGFLRYKPFADAEGKDRPLITFYYHLTDGDQVEVSANRSAVFYNGKKHIMKHGDSFVKLVEGIFYLQYFVES